MEYKKVVGRCPCCKHSVAYANDAKERKNVIISIAPEEYNGITILCAKCKTMLALTERQKITARYKVVPIVENIIICEK